MQRVRRRDRRARQMERLEETQTCVVRVEWYREEPDATIVVLDRKRWLAREAAIKDRRAVADLLSQARKAEFGPIPRGEVRYRIRQANKEHARRMALDAEISRLYGGNSSMAIGAT